MPQIPPKIYDVAKTIGEALSVLVADKNFSVIDNIAKATDAASLLTALYPAYRLLASSGDVYAKALKEKTEELLERLKEERKPQEIAMVASIIGVYAISNGLLKALSKKERKV